MEETIKKILALGKGILAADESTGTIEKRFAAIGIVSTEESRRDYREMLFTAPGMAEYISGVILYEETLFQKTKNGTLLADVLKNQGIIPGIKVDKGTVPLKDGSLELITQGLEGLGERLKKFKAAGAQFAKWRAVITIGKGIPTDECILKNAESLASYAKLCQENGIVPIVEPEVLMDGDHSIEKSYEITEATLRAVFAALKTHEVSLHDMILKPNMVIPGKKNPAHASPDQVSDDTLRCFKNIVPSDVPGIAFLSGGQADEEATANLNAMNNKGKQSWVLTFSYGRALQAPALKTWAGKVENVKAAQAAFLKRAKLNSAATRGAYNASME